MLHVRGDVGGFAVNEDASELTWNVYVGPGFILSENMTLLAGYRWLDIDREKGSDTEADLTFSGPMVGLYIRF
jgi:opacity protein-like surface antigen